MTELSSQLYDGGAADGGSVYVAPPWLRVTPVDPISLAPVPDGEVGLARFTDLGNIDSALNVLTQDRVRRVGTGIMLLGRQPGARLRGCSLAAEALSSATSGVAPGGSGMMSPNAAAERIEQLLRIMRRLVEPGSTRREALCERLVSSTGLSPSGVEWALDGCLELQPTADELASLAGSVRPSERAHVILPANVFVAAHRALALALAAAPRVFVKPSRRDPALVEALSREAPQLFERVSELEVRAGDQVWAYGSDTTLDALRATLPAGAILHVHGSGFGVAVVDFAGTHAPDPAAQRRVALAIAEDTACFDQRGCLSPRLVLALGGSERVARFGVLLAECLVELEKRLPRGRLAEGELAEARWYRECAACFGTLHDTGRGAVNLGLDLVDLSGQTALPIDIPPPGRHLELLAVSRLEPALSGLRRWVTAVGCSDEALEGRVRHVLPRARVGPVGSMQRPPFDGPVDRRSDPTGELIGS